MSLASAVSDAPDRPSASMRGVVKLAAMVLVGTLVGLVTAYQTVSGRIEIVSQTKGPWTVWPAAGTPQVDPYTRAHFLLAGRLPSSNFEAIEFETRRDADGRPLDGSCVYTIAVPSPRARWWSLSALAVDPADTVDEAVGRSSSALSQAVVRAADGTAQLVLSSEARPGNWMSPPGQGPLVLLYRVYNAEPALRASPLLIDLPAIRREACP